MNEDFKKALDNFIVLANAMISKYYASSFPGLDPKKLEYSVGKKYVKVISSTSVWAFIDISNGNILKAAGRNAPAKHARGNIYNDNPLDGVDHYGPLYMK